MGRRGRDGAIRRDGADVHDPNPAGVARGRWGARLALVHAVRACGIGLAAGLLLAAPASGALKYVDPVSGDDGNSGDTSGDAYATIAQAAANVSSGDGVVLMAGTHSGSVTGPAGTMWWGAIGSPTAAILPGISLSTADNVSVKYVQVNGGISIGGGSSGDTLLNVTMRDTTATFTLHGDNAYLSGLDVMAFRFDSRQVNNNFDGPFTDIAADNVVQDSKFYINCTSGSANAVDFRQVLRNTYQRVMWHVRYGGSFSDAVGFALYNITNSGFYNCRFDLYNAKTGTQNNVKISIDVRDQVLHDSGEPSGFLVFQACTLLVGSAQYANDILFSNGGSKYNCGRNRYDSLLVIDRAAGVGLNSVAQWQHHMEGDTVKNSVFVSSRQYPVWMVYKNDSTLVQHNTFVRTGSGPRAMCFYCDGYSCVNEGCVTQNTDATNVSRRNIIYGATAPTAGTPGLVVSNLTYGNQRIQESLYYAPSGNPNYAIYRTDGILWSPSSYNSASRWGNPKFLMSDAVLQSSAAMDSIVSWIFVQGKNPFALQTGSYAVNNEVNGSPWTDGYVGAFGPVSATTPYKFISTSGSGTDCSETSPCLLQFGMSIAAAGDTVRLLEGNYAGDSSVTPTAAGTVDKPIYIVGVGTVVVDSVIIKTSHVIVDSINATHAEILELDEDSPVEYSQIRHADYGQMWMSGASHSTFLDCDVRGPVKVLGTWRAGLGGSFPLTRNGEAYRDTLRRLRMTDTLTTSAPRLFDVRYSRDCLFDSLNVRGWLNATTDTVLARRVAYSVDDTWQDNRWRFAAGGDGPLAFAHGDSVEAALFERETWEADSTGTYIVAADLARDDGDGLGTRNNVYRDCWFTLTGSSRLSGIYYSTIIDSTIFYSRHRPGLLMSGEAWGLEFKFNTVYGAYRAIQSDADVWHDSGVLSNIFVADTLADSSSAVVSYQYTSLRPYQWNFNDYYAYRSNSSTIKDVSQHAVAAEGRVDSTMGVGGWTNRLQPKHPLLWGFDVTDGSSLWGDPAFNDTTFATLDLTPVAGSAAKRSDWPEGYSGAIAPETDTTPPDDVADLEGFVTGGGSTLYLTWTEVGDDGSTGRAYIVYIAHEQKLVGQPSLLSSSTFESYRTPTELSPPSLPGATETVVLPSGSYYPGAQNYYMIKVCDGAGNCSYSNKVGPL